MQTDDIIRRGGTKEALREYKRRQDLASFMTLALEDSTGSFQWLVQDFLQSPDHLRFAVQRQYLKTHIRVTPVWVRWLGPGAQREDMRTLWTEARARLWSEDLIRWALELPYLYHRGPDPRQPSYTYRKHQQDRYRLLDALDRALAGESVQDWVWRARLDGMANRVRCLATMIVDLYVWDPETPSRIWESVRRLAAGVLDAESCSLRAEDYADKRLDAYLLAQGAEKRCE